MEISPMEKFCNSAFWDVNLTWNTNSPRFTPCFHKTVLIWIPSLFLWTFSWIDIYFSLASKTRNIPWNWRNLSKLATVGVLIALSIFDFSYNSFVTPDIRRVDIVTPLIKILTLVLCGSLIFSHVKYGQRTSGVLFFFCFLVILLGIPQLVWEIEARLSGEKNPTQISYFVFYFLSCILFILYFFADLTPTQSDYPKTEQTNPKESSSFPSRLTFSWFGPLAFLGFKKPLNNDDLWPLLYSETAAANYGVFDKHWTTSVKRNSKVFKAESAKFRKNGKNVDISGIGKTNAMPTSILPALCKGFGPTFVFGAFLKLIYDLLTFVSPQLLFVLIDYINSNQPLWRGLLYSGSLFGVTVLQTFLNAHHSYMLSLTGLRIRTALTAAIYRKALKLSNTARKGSTVGEIVNLISVDAQRFMEFILYFNLVWSAPLQIGLALFFLWQLLGPCVLTGLAVMIVMLPLNSFTANRIKMLQVKQMQKKDERVKMMNELLSGIKILKLYAWEPTFEKLVMKIREKEIKVLKQAAYFNVATAFIWVLAPFLVTFITFATYIMLDENNILDAQKAFVSLSLFNIIRMPLSMVSMMVSSLVQTLVSIKRINKFMNSEEINANAISHNKKEGQKSYSHNTLNMSTEKDNAELNKLLPTNNSHCDDQCMDEENIIYPEDTSLVIEKGTFSWGCDEDPTLTNINLRVKKGSLVAIVGAVGSGKSSLISAFLGEMDKKFGRVNINGTIAYVPQLAWIQNKSLQDNILFGKTMNKTLYTKVIEACALKPDLEMLPAGDQTEIGEKGINLSGGQKQRISLARAVYNDSDIYFLDDPLSAVDSHVGKHVFEHIISSKGILGKKTRLFVTHSVTFLPEVDHIVVLKDGIISELGTYKELVEGKGAFSEFLAMHSLEEGIEDNEDFDNSVKQKIISSSDSDHQHQLSSNSRSSSLSSLNRKASSTSLEKNNKSESKRLIKDETSEIGGVKFDVYKHYLSSIGVCMSVAAIFFSFVNQVLYISSNFWLSKWTSEIRNSSDSPAEHVYLEVFGIFGIFLSISHSLTILFWSLGCVMASVTLHNNLLRRILRAPLSFFETTPLGRILNRFSSDLSMVDLYLPLFTDRMISFIAFVFGTIIIVSFSTPIFIVAVIPIGIIYFLLQRYFIATSRQLKRLESVSRSPVYSHFSESIAGCSSIRAYNAQDRFIRELDEKINVYQMCSFPGMIADRWLSIRLEMIGNLIIYFSSLFAVLGKDSLSPGIVGLSVSSTLQITQMLTWLVSMTAQLETNIVSVERIKEYSEISQEAAWELEPSPVSSKWPEEGRVEFSDYKVRYRAGLDLVLKGISFTINSSEKIGIVGRTGAGKSSLTLCLFRIIEAGGGKIVIDGCDISKLGLHTLRSRLTIIPQDPVIFSGSLRVNLDPFSQYSDEQIWHVLELSHLKSYVKGLNSGLQYILSEGGENLSVGQRQLICLARALLRKTKILVLDEATAAVDLETDELIQKTIRTEFKDCTVLTIAHRLNTILDSDRVLVLDNGMAVEYDSPAELLKNKNSIFYGMVHNAGLI